MHLFDLPTSSASGAPAPDTPESIIQQLSVNCRRCALGKTFDPQNRGLSIEGQTRATVAFLGDYPAAEGADTRLRRPLPAAQKKEAEKWATGMGLDPEEVFYVNVVQCRTAKAGQGVEREPLPREIQACFPARALRLLQVLPNLKYVVCLGWTAASVLLGRHPLPTAATHEGRWFGSDLLPGIAVFVLRHPRACFEEHNPAALARTREYCRNFRQEREKILLLLEEQQAKRLAS